jgi:hypothetical protein
MQFECPQCHAVLDFADKRPSFCAFCGHALSGGRPTQQPTVGAKTPPWQTPAGKSTATFDPEGATLPPSAAGPSAAPDADPEAVGGYRLLRVLGQGGMGKVYEAEDTASGRHVALKLIASEFATSKETVERFRQEGKLASMVTHPRCVFVLAADEEAGRPYIVMELMPGKSLHDVVQEKGRLPIGEAVAKILDVMDGLQEAHHLGVIHRDVKPSNCFLDADGRVKIGDFGLSKSLVSSSHLTRTGAFMGTPLYAAPEQIRGDKVNEQTDVYSVAATLYCLIAGRAPFQSGDAAATLARIVADDPPPLRSLRPEVPAPLDKIILRGLSRDRSERWPSLEEFRRALLPFAPGHLTPAGPGIRFAALLIDMLIAGPIGAALHGLYAWVAAGDVRHMWEPAVTMQPTYLLLSPLISLVYYVTLEGVWDGSLGKRLVGLRVRTADGLEPPGVLRALVRTLVYYPLETLGPTVLSILMAIAYSRGDVPDNQLAALMDWRVYAVTCSQYPLEALGITLLLCTMRRRNGYRGLHEFASGTRVIRLPERERHGVVLPHHLDQDQTPLGDLPNRIGHFTVRGALGTAATGKVLLAEDTALGRQVVVWMRPPDGPELTAARRELGRATRLRWLAGDEEADRKWDAFLAPTGCPLPQHVARAGRLPWILARPLLEALTEELVAACADGTLPRGLTVAQVWVQSGDRVLLLEVPLSRAGEGPAAPDDVEAAPDERALALLAQVAVLLLEGRPRRADDVADPRAPVRAPLPGSVRKPLARLVRAAEPYQSVSEWQAALAATRDQPQGVTRTRRMAHLALLGTLLFFGLGCMVPVGCAPSQGAGEAAEGVKKGEAALHALEAGAAREFILGNLGPSPAARLGAFVRLDAALELRTRLEVALERQREERNARLATLGPAGRYWAAATEGQAEELRKLSAEGKSGFLHMRAPNLTKDFWAHAEAAARVEQMQPVEIARVLTVVVALSPVLWVVWAFLFRGGFSFRMAGIQLLRGNGRKALRIQCAWRAFLVWLPVVNLLVASVWLEARYWIAWQHGATPVWELWLSSACYWLAMGLLPVYVLLALWWPTRSLHDRLAGTYLVPR